MASTRVVSISGRQRVVREKTERQGLYFTLIAKHRRSVYQQFDGRIELADLCTCGTDWTPDFEVTRSVSCVIDQHRKQAIDEEWRDAG